MEGKKARDKVSKKWEGGCEIFCAAHLHRESVGERERERERGHTWRRIEHPPHPLLAKCECRCVKVFLKWRRRICEWKRETDRQRESKKSIHPSSAESSILVSLFLSLSLSLSLSEDHHHRRRLHLSRLRCKRQLLHLSLSYSSRKYYPATIFVLYNLFPCAGCKLLFALIPLPEYRYSIRCTKFLKDLSQRYSKARQDSVTIFGYALFAFFLGLLLCYFHFLAMKIKASTSCNAIVLFGPKDAEASKPPATLLRCFQLDILPLLKNILRSET